MRRSPSPPPSRRSRCCALAWYRRTCICLLQWLVLGQALVDWLSRSFYGWRCSSLRLLDPRSTRPWSDGCRAWRASLIAAAILARHGWCCGRGSERPDALVYAVVVLALLLCWPRLWRYAFADVIAPILVIAVLDCRNGIGGIVRAIGYDRRWCCCCKHGTRARRPARYHPRCSRSLPSPAGLAQRAVMLQRKSAACIGDRTQSSCSARRHLTIAPTTVGRDREV